MCYKEITYESRAWAFQRVNPSRATNHETLQMTGSHACVILDEKSLVEEKEILKWKCIKIIKHERAWPNIREILTR